MQKAYQFDSTSKPKIKDLCQEDKKKIGKLIKKLAQEREEKEQLLKKLSEMQQSEQKQQRLQTEIEKLDEEIIQLENNELQYQTPLLQSDQNKMKLIYKFENDDENQHQSPNFKVCNQINDDQSSSFIIPISQRESPLKVDEQIQTSMIQPQILQLPTGNVKKSSKKKEILMKKIQEFEKIVNRLNFSNEQSLELTTNRKSEELQSQSDNTSYLQNVFQKLLCLEQQQQQQQANQQTLRSTIRSEQQSEIQQINEDDLIIQLLNSDTSIYKPEKPQMQCTSKVSKLNQSRQQSTVNENHQKSFPKKNQFESIPSPIVQEAYCKNVMQKYNTLLQELNRQQ